MSSTQGGREKFETSFGSHSVPLGWDNIKKGGRGRRETMQRFFQNKRSLDIEKKNCKPNALDSFGEDSSFEWKKEGVNWARGGSGRKEEEGEE